MIETGSASEQSGRPSVVPPGSDQTFPEAARGVRLTTAQTVESVAIALGRSSRLVAWGLLALGVVAGLEQVVPLALDGEATKSAWSRAAAGALFSILAFGLAGITWSVIARFSALAVCQYIERFALTSDELLAAAARISAELDRIAQHVAQAPWPASAAGEPEPDHRGRLGEIRRAIHASEWELAQSLLSEFAAEFPAHSHHAVLERELHLAKHETKEKQLEKLEAAREVNDPDGVLECYQSLVRTLEPDARAALDRDLARWFLALIHRRLRSAKIESDVVQLAARFAEAFASTVEGASVRASLPTLRRSVGLCPRCGSPYVGIAEACPGCLAGSSARATDPNPTAHTPSAGASDQHPAP
jgi:hypothetical protein